MPQQSDLFGREPSQRELFGGGEAPSTIKPVTPETVREKMRLMLAQLRDAERMPWSERKVRITEVVFPQMANWLSPEERDQFCFEFAQEIERLKKAA